MDTNTKVKQLIEDVLREMGELKRSENDVAPVDDAVASQLEDLAAVDLKTQLLVPQPANPAAYLKLKKATVSRIGIWHSGARYLTEPYLRFRADHAVAQDAVFSEVSADFLKEWGLPELKTPCENKDQFLTRPDLGRTLDDENTELLRNNCPAKARVQIYIADGLSSTAVETNARDTYLALEQGLKGYGIELGKPFFLRYGRVPSMDAVSDILQPEVTVLLIGERPGLATGESMSCYMAYRATAGMPEANRTVLSNIHKGGTPAVEAGAHIAEIVKKILEQKVSGLELKK